MAAIIQSDHALPGKETFEVRIMANFSHNIIVLYNIIARKLDLKVLQNGFQSPLRLLFNFLQKSDVLIVQEYV